MAVDVRVLGPPSVSVDDHVVPLAGRPLQLVIRLALSHPVPLVPMRLVTELWEDDSGTIGALRVTVNRARQALGEGVLVHTERGYGLRPCDVDVRRFEQLAHAGRDRSNSMERRIRAHEQALAEWGGEPFEGMGGARWVDVERTRLTDIREQVEDERFELLLLGDSHELLVPELRLAVARTPVREHRVGLLAVALYRAGRQSDALAVIESTREELLERLGLDMGPELRSIELRILQHDARLATPQLAATQQVAEEVTAKLRAALALLRAGVVRETERIIDDAEALAREGGDRRSMCEVLIARAQLSMWSGEGDPDVPLAAARQIARRLHDGQLLARCALTQFSRGLELDRLSVLVELLEAVPLLPPSAPEVVQLLCCAAALIMFSDASEASHRLLEEAQRAHRMEGSDRSAAIVHVVSAIRSSIDALDPARAALEARTAYELSIGGDDAALLVVTAQAAIRAAYDVGDLDEVDAILERLEVASRNAMMPFGVARVALCRTTNALVRGRVADAGRLWAEGVALGRQLRTHATEVAARAQRLMLMLEDDDLGVIGATASAVLATRSEASIWDALGALADPLAVNGLVEVLPRFRRDDSFPAICAVVALAAARHDDRTLAEWCLQQFADHGDRAVVIGLGTVAMGYRDHFAGLALAVLGRHDEAVQRFQASADRSATRGLTLWWATSSVERAALAAEMGEHQLAVTLLRTLKSHEVFGESARLRRRHAEVHATTRRR